MSKKTFAVALAASVALCVQSQEPRPLRDAELLKIDGFSSGDPLGKEPLGTNDTPVRRAEKAPAGKEKGPTEITAKRLDFDQRTNNAIFTGDVVVNDPEFDMTCDKLTAVLKSRNKEKPSGDNAAPKPVPAADPPPGTAPDKPGKNDKGGGLEKAIAEGHVFITQDRTEADGSVNHNTGKSERAIYDAVTGEMTLLGSPEATQGANKCIALQPDTRLIFTRDGKMRAEGPAKFVVQESAAERKPATEKKPAPEKKR